MGATKHNALPSGDRAGDSSTPTNSVNRAKRTLDGVLFSAGFRAYDHAANPAVAISAPASIHNQERPVVVAGKIEIRPLMYLSLSYDHRIVDRQPAVSFLSA